MFIFIGSDSSLKKAPTKEWFREYLSNHDSSFWEQENGEGIIFRALPWFMFWKKAYVSYVRRDGTFRRDPSCPSLLIRQPKDGQFYIEIDNNVPFEKTGSNFIIESMCGGEVFPIHQDSLIDFVSAIKVLEAYLSNTELHSDLNWVNVNELPIKWNDYY